MTKYMKTRRHMCVWCPHDVPEARSLRNAQNLSNRWVIHYCDVFVFRI